MKNVKINLDRPPLDSNSINEGKDFETLLNNHAIMSKPFYKSTWFIGTTGLASIGLVVGGIIGMNQNESKNYLNETVAAETAAPPENSYPNQHLIAMNAEIDPKDQTENLVKDTFTYSENIQKQTNDKKSTLDNLSTQSSTVKDVSSQEAESIEKNDQKSAEIIPEANSQEEEFSATSLMPRIGGKLNGSISKEELFDNKGITTESDVHVIHFELHLIDGLGGKVFEEASNQLNGEMKEALKKINKGETVYFENIKGKTKQGEVVRLNPLRYVLMN
ncbi:MAG: hypothetical protein WDZ35_08545 [Crocinitomicaceae bacterium]